MWFVLAIYLDNIFPNTSGVRKSVLYFLDPGYWSGKGGNKSEGTRQKWFSVGYYEFCLVAKTFETLFQFQREAFAAV